MRNLFLAAALVLGGTATYATTTLPQQPVVNEITAEGFTEISADKLPEAVLTAVQKDFEGATIAKAYVNEKEQYKLELSVEGAVQTVYASKTGEWLKEVE
ncbi:hypothetical protein [Bizionia paragorgiae]|uniref:Beta-lactamase-inhibitor-like, PepSY-like n=1 Tax=Bizionia paragorgiae TaxID=283786 RepID=A0A1H3VFA0_BIZPA|nr:hypothetical protein [Bizionia paragorgiae]SDZ73436.1 hypothetical protein SAMN04487990_101108 [Bizionia paragorgiae]